MIAAEVSWEHLCDLAERRYGHATARVYPFMRLEPLKNETTPLVRTHLGRARVISVVHHIQAGHEFYDLVEVVLESDIQAARNHIGEGPAPVPPIHRLAPNEVLAPVAPPPSWMAELYLPEVEL